MIRAVFLDSGPLGLVTQRRGKSADVHVILAAQALSTALHPSDIVVATSNASHISRFIAADVWQSIHP